MRPVSILLLTLLGSASCASAFAQELPQVTPKRQLDLGVRGTVTYETNVARGTDDIARQRDLRPEDTLFNASGTVDFVQPLGKQAIFLKGSAGYTFYRKNTKLDTRTADISGGGVKTFGSSCRALAFGGYSADQGQLDDIIGNIVKNLQERTSYAAALECQPTSGFGLVLSAQSQKTTNSAVRQKSQNSTTDSATAVLAYSRPSLGTLRLIANFAETKFPNRDPLLDALGDRLNVTSYGVSYERKFGTRIETQATAQRTLIKRNEAPVGVPLKTNATTYDGSIVYHMGTRLDLKLTGNRSVTPSNRIGQLYDLTRDWGISANYKLGTRVELEGGYRNERTTSKGDGTAVLGPILTNSDNDVFFGAIRYRRTQGMGIGLEVRQEERETNLPAFDYTNTAVSLSVDVPF